MALEFRVRWQRDGRNPTYRIFQSWEAACRKVKGLKALEDIRDEFEQYDDMPSFADPPTLQFRVVGEWQEHSYQPTPSDYTREAMRDHARWNQPVSSSAEVDPF